jgi:histidinol dehydrogenase
VLEVVDGRGQATPVRIIRPVTHAREVEDTARAIVDRVRLEGDAALRDLSECPDGVSLRQGRVRVEREALVGAVGLVPPELVDALGSLAARLRATSQRVLPQSWVERRGGASAGEIVRPLARVGICLDSAHAGRPSTVAMAVVPAQVAGVDGIAVACAPNAHGEVAAPVLAACAVLGVDEVYRLGGAHAVAALAYGTETVRPVDKIVGPGGAYVTAAKRAVAGWVAVDGTVEDTELAVIADRSAEPDAVAADLLAQAEQAPHGLHVLLAWEPRVAERVLSALELQVLAHERADEVENALTAGGYAVLVRDQRHALDTVTALAPARVALAFEGALAAVDLVRSAGAVFVGAYSPPAAAEYAGVSNQLLPAGGTARWASGLSVRDFVRTISVTGFDRVALEREAAHVAALAEAEALPGHERAVRTRLGRPGASG